MTSYLLTIILVLITFYLSSKLLFIKQYSSQQPNIEFLYPLISGIAINTIILIIINGYIINKEKLQAQEENRQLRISQLETENKLLLQQLQPHFLFNALSTLKSLIRTQCIRSPRLHSKIIRFSQVFVQRPQEPASDRR